MLSCIINNFTHKSLLISCHEQEYGDCDHGDHGDDYSDCDHGDRSDHDDGDYDESC